MDLPSEIIEIIKDCLWGNHDEWKAKLSQIIKLFPHENNLIENLNDSGDYEETYCPQCGEKELFPFSRTICFYCDTYIYKYPFNTFSGGNQGCFYLHNTYILLYRSFIHKHSYYPNHARCWGTPQWRRKRYMFTYNLAT